MNLIDADKLIEDITNTINEWIKEMPDGEYLKGNVNFAEMAKEIVRNQPTAFDVDKVISNIWDKSELIHIKHNCYDEIEDYIRTTDASEIVRKGGIDVES